MTTALATFEPANVSEAMALADQLAKSSLLPSALRGKPADVLVVLATARELGIGPMQGLSDINVIQGKPVFSADLMVAQCKRRPDVCKFIRLVESTEERAVYETQRAGSPEPERFTFTMADAEGLGLRGKDNWRKQPKTMLRRRAAAQLAREVYPDLVRGYDPDEAEDFARPRPVPVEVVPPEPKPPSLESPPQIAEAVEVLGGTVENVEAPRASGPKPIGDVLKAAIPAESLLLAIACAPTRADLNRLGKDIRSLHESLQPEARAAFNKRAEELKS